MYTLCTKFNCVVAWTQSKTFFFCPEIRPNKKIRVDNCRLL